MSLVPRTGPDTRHFHTHIHWAKLKGHQPKDAEFLLMTVTHCMELCSFQGPVIFVTPLRILRLMCIIHAAKVRGP